MIALTALALTAQFDLLCTGAKQVGLSTPEPVERRIRVDLSAMRWCQFDCARAFPIAEASTDTLVLDRAGDNDRTAVTRRLTTVNRVTGEWRVTTLESGFGAVDTYVRGTCTLAEFTGLPAAKF